MNEGTKQENARQSVTTNFSSESFRKKRQEDTLSIRKQRREEQHLARRQRTISLTPSPSSTPSPAPDQELQPLASQPVPGVETLTDENAVVAALASADVEKQLQATNKLRMVLSSSLCSVLCFHFCVFFFWVHTVCLFPSGANPPIDQVVSLNCIPYLVRFLSSPSIKLQFEAAWTLTNSLSLPLSLFMIFINLWVTHVMQQNSCEWKQ